MREIGARMNALGTRSRKFVEDGDILFSAQHPIFKFTTFVHMAGL